MQAPADAGNSLLKAVSSGAGTKELDHDIRTVREELSSSW
jgi:hypothetical protein